MAELDGRNRKVLVWSDLESPRAIALHYHLGLMYWSDWGKNPRIEQADMNGENRCVHKTSNACSRMTSLIMSPELLTRYDKIWHELEAMQTW